MRYALVALALLLTACEGSPMARGYPPPPLQTYRPPPPMNSGMNCTVIGNQIMCR